MVRPAPLSLHLKKFEQNYRCQNERKLSVFPKFLNILRLAGMFYIIYIKKIFDWSKNELMPTISLKFGVHARNWPRIDFQPLEFNFQFYFWRFLGGGEGGVLLVPARSQNIRSLCQA